MDRRLLERLVGGAILLAVLSVTVPLLLTGEGPADAPLVQLPAVAGSGEMRTHVITPERGPAEPPVPQHLPPPEPVMPPEPAEEPAAIALEPAAPAPDQPPAASGPVPAPDPAPAPAAPAAAPSPPPARTPPPVTAPVTAPAARAAANTGTGWVVQIGSFQSQVNADRLAAELRQREFQAYVTPLRSASGTLYRVRVGPPAAERSAAQDLAARLQRSGYSGQVTRQEP